MKFNLFARHGETAQHPEPPEKPAQPGQPDTNQTEPTGLPPEEIIALVKEELPPSEHF